MATINEIAEELHKLNESIVLIYALNSSGKTRLSVAYKDFTKANNDGNHAGVYFNAFSEDLFVWDNDEVNDHYPILEMALNPLSEQTIDRFNDNSGNRIVLWVITP